MRKLLLQFLFGISIVLAIASATLLQNYPLAFAQQDQPAIAIESSADPNGGNFFGEAFLQVLITNTAADNDGTIETMTASIDAKSDSGSTSTHSISIPETSKSSGMFEFLLVHVNADAVEPAELRSVNSYGVEGDGSCSANCAPIVTFGPGGDLDLDSNVYEDVRFEIMVHDTHAIVNYKETPGKLSLDRESYGSNSFVYVSIRDQDANLNPFERDEFIVNADSAPNEDLFELNGGEFNGGDVIFRETGDNTGMFEAKYQLGVSIDINSKSPVLLMHEKANYDDDLNAPENDSNDTDEVSFSINNGSGSVVGGGSQEVSTEDGKISTDKVSYMIGEMVYVSIADADANINPDRIDSVPVRIAAAGDSVILTAHETAYDSGIFASRFALASNGSEFPQETDNVLTVDQNVDKLTISYIDERPANYSESLAAGQNAEKTFTMTINVHSRFTGIDSTSLTKPVLKDSNGRPLSEIVVGHQSILSTTISNRNNASQPFVAIVEVRDSNGITVFLAWQTGSLNPSGQAEVGLSWTPDQAGFYLVRTFTISSFKGDEILSPISSNEFVVSK